MDDEKQRSIKIVDRRRFYLDDEGEVREKATEEKIIDLSDGTEVVDRKDENQPERRRDSWWNRLRKKLGG